MVLLDTHIWLWWLLGDGSLSTHERSSLDELAASGNVAVSWVTLWETEMLERKGRISLLPDFESWVRKAVNPGVCTVLSADLDVILSQRKLPVAFHADPADRLIAATSILSGYPLATHDCRIIASEACDIWTAR